MWLSISYIDWNNRKNDVGAVRSILDIDWSLYNKNIYAIGIVFLCFFFPFHKKSQFLLVFLFVIVAAVTD